MSDFEREAAKGIHSGFNACMYREQCRAALSDPTPMVTMDDGSSVHLDSYTGGAHEAGAWGELTLRFEHGGVATTRRYREVAAPTPSASSVPVAWVEKCEMEELLEAASVRFGVTATLWPEQGDPDHNYVPLYAAPPANPAPSVPSDVIARLNGCLEHAARNDGCTIHHVAVLKDDLRAILQANGATK